MIAREQYLEARQPAIENSKLAMLFFLASETIFFTLLIFAYGYYRQSIMQTGGPGPTAKEALDVVRTAIFTIFLLSSSVTIWLAERSLRKKNQLWFRIWLGTTILCGAIFLTGQGIEYTSLLTADVTVSRDLFGSTFFTLTGFHAVHVLSGLIMLATLVGLGLAGKAKTPRWNPFETISLYWHFVDAVWIVIFSVVYLWTLFS